MKCGKKADRVNTGSHVFVIKYRLGHDLVRLVDKSAPDSRREPTSGLRLELRQTDRESDVATAEGPRDDDRRMA